MRLNAEEADALQRQSRELGLSASSYLRMLLKLTHDRLVDGGKLTPIGRGKRSRR